MKNILLIVLIIPLILHSQARIDSLKGTIYLKEIRQIDLSAKQLKDKAFDWVAKVYNNSNYVVRVNEDDRIITKGSYKLQTTYHKGKYSFPLSINLGYTLDIEFKDGRYKVEVNQMDEINEKVWMHLLSWDDYKEYRLRIAENHEGPGKRAVMKSVSKDENLKEDYNAQKNLAASMVNKTLEHISNLEQNLYNYMKSDQEDDW